MGLYAVTFDCYGTLIDWRRGLCSAVPLQRSGSRINQGEFFDEWVRVQGRLIGSYRPYREIVRMATFLTFSRVGIVPTPEELETAAASMASWPPFDDARRALKALNGKLPLGILSNVEDAVLARSIELLGVPINFTVAAEQVKSYKPNPAHFTECVARLKVPPSDILHVGWLDYDVVPARSVGMKTCWINREREPRPPTAAPDYEIGSLDDLPAIVQSLVGGAAA